MKKPVHITTIKLDTDWEADIVATTRPFTKEEENNIKLNIKIFKAKYEDWKDYPADLLDYAVLSPFKSIVLTTYQTEIE